MIKRPTLLKPVWEEDLGKFIVFRRKDEKKGSSLNFSVLRV